MLLNLLELSVAVTIGDGEELVALSVSKSQLKSLFNASCALVSHGVYRCPQGG